MKVLVHPPTGHLKGFSPVYTTIRFVLTRLYVGPNMNFQPAGPGVAFATLGTQEGFVARMNQFVGFQVALCDKLFVASIETANKRPLSSLHES